MKAVRHDLSEGDEILSPGEYGFHRDNNRWYCRPPQNDGVHIGQGDLSQHTVVEHDDGTITVSPSILITSRANKWHGYLERGIWREV